MYRKKQGCNYSKLGVHRIITKIIQKLLISTRKFSRKGEGKKSILKELDERLIHSESFI